MNLEVNHSPIALFVYDRPGHTRQTMEALLGNAGVSESPLYVFSDAAKNEAAVDRVAEVRSYLRSIVGFKTITIIEREMNHGLAGSIIDGVTLLCEEYGRVIVLEDDLVTSPHFLSYMNAGLAKYENEDSIMQIAGYMFPVNLGAKDEAFFLPFTSSWGWATWKRAWKHFDAKMAGYRQLAADKNLRYAFNLKGHYDYFRMLESQMKGKADSWAIRWYLSVFLASGLVLYPRKSLVRNVGFDGSGVNCVASGYDEGVLEDDFHATELPERIGVADCYEELLRVLPKPEVSFRAVLNRVRHSIRSAYARIN